MCLFSFHFVCLVCNLAVIKAQQMIHHQKMKRHQSWWQQPVPVVCTDARSHLSAEGFFIIILLQKYFELLIIYLIDWLVNAQRANVNFFVHSFLLHNDIKNEEVTGVLSSNHDSGTPAIPLSPTSLPVMFDLFYHNQGKNGKNKYKKKKRMNRLWSYLPLICKIQSFQWKSACLEKTIACRFCSFSRCSCELTTLTNRKSMTMWNFAEYFASVATTLHTQKT